MCAIDILLSVSIITYNHEKYISEAIESVLKQITSFEFNLVICDDGSTDKTREILSGYYRKFPNKIILRLRDQNLGLKANYFDNILACRSKYIAICEGDDYWTDPYKLQKQVDFLEANSKYSMCFHSAYELHEFEDGSTTTNIFSDLENRTYQASEILLNWIVPTASVIFRNSISFRYTYLNDFLFYDIVLFMSLAQSGRIWCIPETMCVYRRHPNSITNSDLKYEQYIKHLKAINKEFNYKYNKEIRILLGMEYFKQFKSSLKRFSIKSISFLILSLWYDFKGIYVKVRLKLCS